MVVDAADLAEWRQDALSYFHHKMFTRTIEKCDKILNAKGSCAQTTTLKIRAMWAKASDPAERAIAIAQHHGLCAEDLYKDATELLEECFAACQAFVETCEKKSKHFDEMISILVSCARKKAQLITECEADSSEAIRILSRLLTKYGYLLPEEEFMKVKILRVHYSRQKPVLETDKKTLCTCLDNCEALLEDLIRGKNELKWPENKFKPVGTIEDIREMATVARDKYRSCLEKIDPDYTTPTAKKKKADVNKNLGNTKYKDKKYADAINWYNKAIDIWPDAPEYWTNKACAQTELMKEEQAKVNSLSEKLNSVSSEQGSHMNNKSRNKQQKKDLEQLEKQKREIEVMRRELEQLCDKILRRFERDAAFTQPKREKIERIRKEWERKQEPRSSPPGRNNASASPKTATEGAASGPNIPARSRTASESSFVSAAAASPTSSTDNAAGTNTNSSKNNNPITNGPERGDESLYEHVSEMMAKELRFTVSLADGKSRLVPAYKAVVQAQMELDQHLEKPGTAGGDKCAGEELRKKVLKCGEELCIWAFFIFAYAGNTYRFRGLGDAWRSTNSAARSTNKRANEEANELSSLMQHMPLKGRKVKLIWEQKKKTKLKKQDAYARLDDISCAYAARAGNLTPIFGTRSEDVEEAEHSGPRREDHSVVLSAGVLFDGHHQTYERLVTLPQNFAIDQERPVLDDLSEEECLALLYCGLSCFSVEANSERRYSSSGPVYFGGSMFFQLLRDALDREDVWGACAGVHRFLKHAAATNNRYNHLSVGTVDDLQSGSAKETDADESGCGPHLWLRFLSNMWRELSAGKESKVEQTERVSSFFQKHFFNRPGDYRLSYPEEYSTCEVPTGKTDPKKERLANGSDLHHADCLQVIADALQADRYHFANTHGNKQLKAFMMDITLTNVWQNGDLGSLISIFCVMNGAGGMEEFEVSSDLLSWVSVRDRPKFLLAAAKNALLLDDPRDTNNACDAITAETKTSGARGRTLSDGAAARATQIQQTKDETELIEGNRQDILYTLGDSDIPSENLLSFFEEAKPFEHFSFFPLLLRNFFPVLVANAAGTSGLHRLAELFLHDELPKISCHARQNDSEDRFQDEFLRPVFRLYEQLHSERRSTCAKTVEGGEASLPLADALLSEVDLVGHLIYHNNTEYFRKYATLTSSGIETLRYAVLNSDGFSSSTEKLISFLGSLESAGATNATSALLRDFSAFDDITEKVQDAIDTAGEDEGSQLPARIWERYFVFLRCLLEVSFMAEKEGISSLDIWNLQGGRKQTPATSKMAHNLCDLLFELMSRENSEDQSGEWDDCTSFSNLASWRALWSSAAVRNLCATVGNQLERGILNIPIHELREKALRAGEQLRKENQTFVVGAAGEDDEAEGDSNSADGFERKLDAQEKLASGLADGWAGHNAVLVYQESVSALTKHTSVQDGRIFGAIPGLLRTLDIINAELASLKTFVEVLLFSEARSVAFLKKAPEVIEDLQTRVSLISICDFQALFERKEDAGKPSSALAMQKMAFSPNELQFLSTVAKAQRASHLKFRSALYGLQKAIVSRNSNGSNTRSPQNFDSICGFFESLLSESTENGDPTPQGKKELQQKWRRVLKQWESHAIATKKKLEESGELFVGGIPLILQEFYDNCGFQSEAGGDELTLRYADVFDLSSREQLPNLLTEDANFESCESESESSGEETDSDDEVLQPKCPDTRPGEPNQEANNVINNSGVQRQIAEKTNAPHSNVEVAAIQKQDENIKSKPKEKIETSGDGTANDQEAAVDEGSSKTREVQEKISKIEKQKQDLEANLKQQQQELENANLALRNLRAQFTERRKEHLARVEWSSQGADWSNQVADWSNSQQCATDLCFGTIYFVHPSRQLGYIVCDLHETFGDKAHRISDQGHLQRMKEVEHFHFMFFNAVSVDYTYARTGSIQIIEDTPTYHGQEKAVPSKLRDVAAGKEFEKGDSVWFVVDATQLAAWWSTWNPHTQQCSPKNPPVVCFGLQSEPMKVMLANLRGYKDRIRTIEIETKILKSQVDVKGMLIQEQNVVLQTHQAVHESRTQRLQKRSARERLERQMQKAYKTKQRVKDTLREEKKRRKVGFADDGEGSVEESLSSDTSELGDGIDSEDATGSEESESDEDSDGGKQTQLDAQRNVEIGKSKTANTKKQLQKLSKNRNWPKDERSFRRDIDMLSKTSERKIVGYVTFVHPKDGYAFVQPANPREIPLDMAEIIGETQSKKSGNTYNSRGNLRDVFFHLEARDIDGNAHLRPERGDLVRFLIKEETIIAFKTGRARYPGARSVDVLKYANPHTYLQQVVSKSENGIEEEPNQAQKPGDGPDQEPQTDDLPKPSKTTYKTVLLTRQLKPETERIFSFRAFKKFVENCILGGYLGDCSLLSDQSSPDGEPSQLAVAVEFFRDIFRLPDNLVQQHCERRLENKRFKEKLRNHEGTYQEALMRIDDDDSDIENCPEDDAGGDSGSTSDSESDEESSEDRWWEGGTDDDSDSYDEVEDEESDDSESDDDDEERKQKLLEAKRKEEEKETRRKKKLEEQAEKEEKKRERAEQRRQEAEERRKQLEKAVKEAIYQKHQRLLREAHPSNWELVVEEVVAYVGQTSFSFPVPAGIGIGDYLVNPVLEKTQDGDNKKGGPKGTKQKPERKTNCGKQPGNPTSKAGDAAAPPELNAWGMLDRLSEEFGKVGRDFELREVFRGSGSSSKESGNNSNSNPNIEKWIDNNEFKTRNEYAMKGVIVEDFLRHFLCLICCVERDRIQRSEEGSSSSVDLATLLAADNLVKRHLLSMPSTSGIMSPWLEVVRLFVRSCDGPFRPTTLHQRLFNVLGGDVLSISEEGGMEIHSKFEFFVQTVAQHQDLYLTKHISSGIQPMLHGFEWMIENAKSHSSSSGGVRTRKGKVVASNSTSTPADGAGSLINIDKSDTGKLWPKLCQLHRNVSEPLALFKQAQEDFRKKYLQSGQSDSTRSHDGEEDVDLMNWKQLPQRPTRRELFDPKNTNLPSLPLKLSDSYAHYDDLMRTNVRLLREDCFSALRAGISQYVANGKVSFRDMKIYQPRFVAMHLRDQDTIALVFQIVKPLVSKGSTRIKENMEVAREWFKQGTLKFGSLLCLSLEGHFNDDILLFLTVSWSDPAELEKTGIFFAEIVDYVVAPKASGRRQTGGSQAAPKLCHTEMGGANKEFLKELAADEDDAFGDATTAAVLHGGHLQWAQAMRKKRARGRRLLAVRGTENEENAELDDDDDSQPNQRNVLSEIPLADIILKLKSRSMDDATNTLVIAESPTYFKAYGPVLKCLQTTFRKESDLSFPDEIIYDSLAQSSTKKYGRMPEYLTDARLKLDAELVFGPDRAGERIAVKKCIDEIDLIADDREDKFHLKAISHVLSNRFSMIQGAPGTGKTYLGVKLVMALDSASTAADTINKLSTKMTMAKTVDASKKKANAEGSKKTNESAAFIEASAPRKKGGLRFLVVTQKNRALDQLLTNLAKNGYADSLVRVGNGVTSEADCEETGLHSREDQYEARKNLNRSAWKLAQRGEDRDEQIDDDDDDARRDENSFLHQRTMRVLKIQHQQENFSARQQYSEKKHRLDKVTEDLESQLGKLNEVIFFKPAMFFREATLDNVRSLLRFFCTKMGILNKKIGGDEEEYNSIASRSHQTYSQSALGDLLAESASFSRTEGYRAFAYVEKDLTSVQSYVTERRQEGADYSVPDFLSARWVSSKIEIQMLHERLRVGIVKALESWVPPKKRFIDAAKMINKQRSGAKQKQSRHCEKHLEQAEFRPNETEVPDRYYDDEVYSTLGIRYKNQKSYMPRWKVRLFGNMIPMTADPKIKQIIGQHHKQGELMGVSLNSLAAKKIGGPDSEYSESPEMFNARNLSEEVEFNSDLSDSYAPAKKEKLMEKCRKNLEDCDPNERMLFVQLVMQRYVQAVSEKCQQLIEKHDAIASEKKRGDEEQDIHILRSQKIIGMTITGASIYANILQGVQPDVVIVEEASEVLEPQLLCCLKGAKHLIMIGDHMQLPPLVQANFLKENHNFGKSTFERLIKRNAIFAKLMKQQRMMPELSRYLKLHYGLLEDHPHVRQRLSREGSREDPEKFPLDREVYVEDFTDKRILWWSCHRGKQERIAGSWKNEIEAQRCVRLAQFMIDQGVKPADISILSPYQAQVTKIKQELKKHLDKREAAASDWVKKLTVSARSLDPNAGGLSRDQMKIVNATFGKGIVDVSVYEQRIDGSVGLLVRPKRLGALAQVEVSGLDGFQGNQNEHIIVSWVRTDPMHAGFLKRSEGEQRLIVGKSRARRSLHHIGHTAAMELDSPIPRGYTAGKGYDGKSKPPRDAGDDDKSKPTDKAKPKGGSSIPAVVKYNKIWAKTITALREDGNLHDTVSFFCPRCNAGENKGRATTVGAKDAEDVPDAVIHEGTSLCSRICGATMSCGHVCQQRCHYGPCQRLACTEDVTVECPANPQEHPQMTMKCCEVAIANLQGELLELGQRGIHIEPDAKSKKESKKGNNLQDAADSPLLCEPVTSSKMNRHAFLCPFPIEFSCKNAACGKVLKRKCHQEETDIPCDQYVVCPRNAMHRIRGPCTTPKEQLLCGEPCDKLLDKCGHRCRARCSDVCEEHRCEEILHKKAVCAAPQRHVQAQVYCWQTTSRRIENPRGDFGKDYSRYPKRSFVLKPGICCEGVVEMICSRCGHKRDRKCYEDENSCDQICGKLLKCGHKCRKKCGEKCPTSRQECDQCSQGQRENDFFAQLLDDDEEDDATKRKRGKKKEGKHFTREKVQLAKILYSQDKMSDHFTNGQSVHEVRQDLLNTSSGKQRLNQFPELEVVLYERQFISMDNRRLWLLKNTFHPDRVSIKLFKDPEAYGKEWFEKKFTTTWKDKGMKENDYNEIKITPHPKFSGKIDNKRESRHNEKEPRQNKKEAREQMKTRGFQFASP